MTGFNVVSYSETVWYVLYLFFVFLLTTNFKSVFPDFEIRL